MADKAWREVLAEIDSADREFWATEDDGDVPIRAEEIAERTRTLRTDHVLDVRRDECGACRGPEGPRYKGTTGSL